ncbi:MAG: hypothetical protein COY42_12480 [Armatimonadetes bacterium CG_4_10_14_0_8_um_filter_66_14]|nr:hypothetical protein [Armatimonadota bacterium]OIO93943.1 MAG: hypothetical protein AUJ96_29365 [Armatimonadetes bacterium CG2_30_66_41]PIU93448.1 MAG: hypothetical protein COS65_12720 [Armatimonadetes bacterium CG06_land_8_20_14_3_00_66_21]PIZ45264.1 MAG: hypothetical protein COY42_12480 [Armatimonadetes bacterium CG_4_10_14_0_8_um_filter_66_14]PJB65316.1 MAG: hypothetical protein CO096_18595 [Armatimonadetes bacterium CG_4_9_14_3_um_filter_66_14]
MSVTTSSKEIAQIVRVSLKQHQHNQWVIDVLEEGVRRDGSWWYVPVCPNTDHRSSCYYDILSDVEGELQDKRGLDVLLIPASRN